MTWTGRITNAEYLFDDDIKKFRIYYREDLPNQTVRFGEADEKVVDGFYPSFYKQVNTPSSAKSARHFNEVRLTETGLRETMRGSSWGDKSYMCPMDGYTKEECLINNNSIWPGYPFLKSLRKKPVEYKTGAAVKEDYLIYEPVFDKKKKMSYSAFLSATKKNDSIDDSKITNTIDPEYQWIAQYVHGGKDNGGVKLRYFFLDIEVLIDKGIDVNLAQNPITMIQINDSVTDTTDIFFSSAKRGQYEKQEGVTYHECDSEKEILLEFVKLVNERKPVCLAAWFGSGFDFRYIANRMLTLARNEPDDDFQVKNYESNFQNSKKGKEYCSLMEKLSPYGKVYEKNVNVFGTQERSCYPYGLYFMDYLDVYKQYSYGEKSSFSLEAVCSEDLSVGKVEYKSIADNLDEVYNHNFDLFCKYGVQDVVLLNMLEKKLRYMNIAFMQAASMGINVDDVLATIYPWLHKIYNRCISLGFALPVRALEHIAEDVEFEGGFTFCAPGKKMNLCAFDVTSLYPKTMESYNVSYETLITHKDFDERDKKRWLFVRYGLFQDLYPSIKTVINQNRDPNEKERDFSEKEFTYEVYKRYFGLAQTLKTYSSFMDFNDCVNKFIAGETQLYDALTERLKVAGVCFSHMKCFFDAGEKLTESAIRKIIWYLKGVNKDIPESDLELLEYYFNERCSEIIYDEKFVEENKQKALEKISESRMYGRTFDKFDDLPNKESLIKTIEERAYIAEELNAKGVIPSLIAQTFAERKKAKNEFEAYDGISELIVKEQLRRQAQKDAS